MPDPELAHQDPQEVLQQFWGYPSFRPLQLEAIEAALGKQDVLVILPTGGGKSLCYQVPAAAQTGLVLVVSPLIALMDDQVAGANDVGLKAAALHSAHDDSKRQDIYRDLATGSLDLLYVSPERLMLGDLMEQLASRLALVAIDEAHCISHWGHDFRPEYRQLGEMLGQYPQIPRIALTATATPQVQDDIVHQLGLRSPLRLVGHPDRPNLTYRSIPRSGGIKQIAEVITRHHDEGGIVYAQTRKEVERIASGLQAQGIDAAAYHAGLPNETRSRVQAAFLNESLDVVVATIAFGMGIDRSNVRFVIHANAPRSIEHYQQESGRAGRDGLPAECVLFHSSGDFVTHRQLAELDGPLSPQRKQALEYQLRHISRYAVAPVCRHKLLSEHFGHELHTQTTEATAAAADEAKANGCGACDVCLGETTELPSDEAMLTAQKIISAVWRTNSRFGTGHVAGVLVGSKGERITRLGHDQLSVYGLLKEVGERAVKAWIDQLISQELLQQADSNGYPILQMTASGRALCKGEGEVRLSTALTGSKKERKRNAQAQQAAANLSDDDRSLFDSLRQWRRLVAAAAGIPPYIVFSDATLRELAVHKPADDSSLLEVKGIGQRKAAQYGDGVLALLAGSEAEAAAELVKTQAK